MLSIYPLSSWVNVVCTPSVFRFMLFRIMVSTGMNQVDANIVERCLVDEVIWMKNIVRFCQAEEGTHLGANALAARIASHYKKVIICYAFSHYRSRDGVSYARRMMPCREICPQTPPDRSVTSRQSAVFATCFCMCL